MQTSIVDQSQSCGSSTCIFMPDTSRPSPLCSNTRPDFMSLFEQIISICCLCLKVSRSLVTAKPPVTTCRLRDAVIYRQGKQLMNET